MPPVELTIGLGVLAAFLLVLWTVVRIVRTVMLIRRNR